MASIDELKKLVAAWQKVEDNGGSPTSRGKLLAAKKELAEAKAEAKAEVKPIKKAKKAKKVKKVEEVVEEIAADEEE